MRTVMRFQKKSSDASTPESMEVISMTDESVLDEMLSAGDYEIVMCVLFAEVLAGEMTEQYRNLRMEALIAVFC